MEITEHTFFSERHKTFYRACGPEEGPLIIMTHGWPELSISWRHQLLYLGNKGYRAVAPDMRGYGGSSIYAEHSAYAQREIVKDMIELIDSLGRDKAVWIGHDWGSPVAWNVALHHPERVAAVASLCVPFGFSGRPEDLEYAINRELYPADEYPAGQWDYQLFYYENFDKTREEMEENPERLAKLLFRKGDPNGRGQIAATALTRKNGGWFNLIGGVPDSLQDYDVVSDEDITTYAKHLTDNGFFGPNSWYVNGDANQSYFNEKHDLTLLMPALFVHATYDYVCDTTTTGFAEPMRKLCKDLTEERLDCGHWMAQEKPTELNEILSNWLSGQARCPAREPS